MVGLILISLIITLNLFLVFINVDKEEKTLVAARVASWILTSTFLVILSCLLLEK